MCDALCLSSLEKFKIRIKPDDIHHVLYFAEMFIGDSQTMAAEAAVLGTPSLRFSDFTGKLNYLNELESPKLILELFTGMEIERV